MRPFLRAAERAVAAAALAVAAASAPAASHIVEIAWGSDGRFVRAASVEPDKFIEVCGKLAAGDAVRWSFESTAPVDFNIHYHVGKETVFPSKHAQVRALQDVLRVAVREDHCWMWTNKTSERVAVDVRLQRSGELVREEKQTGRK